MSDDRHSYTEQQELITDPVEKAQREVENGIRQFDVMTDLIRANVKQRDHKFSLRVRNILELQDAALKGIHPLSGTFRNTPITIKGSAHAPPDRYSVPEEVELLCKYVNEHWEESNAIHLAAYILWKLNWIHPFADGNGRTARAVSYAVLCIKLDGLLPGMSTIPEQIAANKGPYYDALEKADEANASGTIDVSALEQMLSEMLARQLVSIAAMSEASEDRIKQIIDSRVRHAARTLVESTFGTQDPVGRLWQLGLRGMVLQIASEQEIDLATKRSQNHGSPFPALLAPDDSKYYVQHIEQNQDGSILRDPKFESGLGDAILMDGDTTIALLNPELSAASEEKSWRARGALYLVKLGHKLTSETAYKAIELLIAKHMNSA
jgi:fido (protein-threonine AMPylation protein)